MEAKSFRNTNSFSLEVVLNELEARGFVVQKSEGDLQVNQKRINIRGCNYDNNWARRRNVLGGWDKINPEKFDYLVCVSFNGKQKDIRFFIFTKEEAQEFSTTTLSGKDQGLKNLELLRNNQESQGIMRFSENMWNKIT